MCVSSMIGDHYRDMWKERPWFPGPQIPVPFPQPIYPQPVEPMPTGPIIIQQPPAITRAEFDELKRQVAEMVELLKRAKKYDDDNKQPDCEMDEKMNLLRKVAKLVGVDLDKALRQPQSG